MGPLRIGAGGGREIERDEMRLLPGVNLYLP